MHLSKLFTAVLAAVLCASCAKDLESLAPFPCGKDGTCPSSYTCQANRCVSSSEASLSCSISSLNVGCTDPTHPMVCGARCCSNLFPYGCDSLSNCYATEAEATAACGTSCVACVATTTAPTCTVSTAAWGCSDSTDLACSSTACCTSDTPYYCASTDQCYPTQSAAAAACGGDCIACRPGSTSASCTVASATSGCQTAADPMACGSGCCPTTHPYTCEASSSCYATEEAALADTACANSCTVCVPHTSGPACSAPPTPSNCQDPNLPMGCGSSKCCAVGSPFYCAASDQCFATQAEAAAACGSACIACTPNI